MDNWRFGIGGSQSRFGDSKSFEPFINEVTLCKRCPLDNERNVFRNEIITLNYGLQGLPVELYHSCLKYLDIGTLTAFRRVSQHSRSIIDSLYEYKMIYDSAPNVIRACLATGVASALPISRLYQTLTSMECYYCRNSDEPQSTFGAYLCLFTGYRVCLFCIRNNLSLKTVDLSTILHLTCKRKSHISSIATMTLLHTLPGTYGPTPPLAFEHSPRSTIVLGSSVKALPGENLTMREGQTLHGNTYDIVYHHPLVDPKDESDILPPGYVRPDKERHIKQRYMSVIRLPYLSTTRMTLDWGMLCKECVLKMQYAEIKWTSDQARRRQAGNVPWASTDRMRSINRFRKAASRMFTVNEQAMTDAYKLIEDGKLVADDLYMEGLSMQSHRLRHAREKKKLDPKEVLWRSEQKGSPFPLLGKTYQFF